MADKHAETDLFEMRRLDHLEFTVADASTAMKILKRGLGMSIIGESRKETGNHTYVSYVLQSDTIKFVVTAPLLSNFKHPEDKMPNPTYDAEKATRFIKRHGNGVNAMGVEVANATEAYKIATERGAKGVVPPTTVEDGHGGKVIFSEIEFYSELDSPDPIRHGDTVLRFIEYQNFTGPFLPGYKAVKDPHPLDYGLRRVDHVVGNVYDMNKICSQLKKFVGFHRFAGFTKEEIQTPWTALNSEVLANNNLKVLLPINESAEGKKESQILEYLKAYNGPGVQHIAVKTANIFATIALMVENSDVGFEFIPTPATYYEDPIIVKRIEENLTKQEAELVKKFGILIDLDSEGVLLQIFTKPLFDRPTLFVEIIQRKCAGEDLLKGLEIPGCGGFGKGNFKALFESIEILQRERGGLLDPNQVQC